MVDGFLKILNLNNQKDRTEYTTLVEKIYQSYPFISLDYIIESPTQLDTLKCFVFYLDNSPEVLMLFHLRPIMIGNRNTGFYDTISPYGYSGPVFNTDNSSENIPRFWHEVDQWYRQNSVVSEFIRFSLNKNHIHYSGCVIKTLATVRGKIVNEEQQLTNFKKKVRNNIRRAIKSNLKAEIHYKNIEEANILEFYTIYTETLDRHKAIERYYFGFDYFKNLLANQSNKFALAIVRKDEIPISVELLILTRQTVYSYLGGTDVDYFKYRPNDFLKFSVINWARKKGFKYYNLGGGQQNDDSLYKYKKSFFPVDEDVAFYTGRKILNESTYNELVAEFCQSSKLPVPESSDPCLGGFFPLYRLES